MKATRIGAVMVRDVVTADRGTPFKEVVRRLGDHRISGLPVIDEDDKVIGVVSETDLMLHQARTSEPDGTLSAWAIRLRKLNPSVRRNAAKSRARTAGEVMSTPAVTVRADATVTEAARVMAEHGIERLPVVDEEDRLAGIVARRDLLQVFLRTDEEIERDVRQEVLVNTLWLAPQIIETTVEDGVVTLTGQLERRSDIPVALGMTSRMDGVVAVVDRLSYRIDDSHLRPAEQAALHGVADDWIRRL
ncbi:CBS domain-containing protein [Streptomyces iakyrus]|uniref:CBS domain-containing protein n=1 Tax=Streptomyces iakyrus TaxID=68219 RepID=A0ABW8F6M8_9ACTN